MLERGRGPVADRADLAVRIVSAALATEAVARRLIADEPLHTSLAGRPAALDRALAHVAETDESAA